jgi:hypothetical protein
MLLGIHEDGRYLEYVVLCVGGARSGGSCLLVAVGAVGAFRALFLQV